MADPGASAPLRLITIPWSHFCEKARWALDRAGVPYREDAYLPLAHALPALRAGGRRSVPVLVSPAGVLHDSTDILRHADTLVPPERALFFRGSREPDADRAEVEALEERFDVDLGPATRRVAYHHLLPDEEGAFALMGGSFRGIDGAGAAPPWWFGRGTFRAYYPVARAVMKRVMRIDAAGAERSRGKLRAVFDAVNERLRDGRPFLVGDRFSAADLTFAALAAPLLAPEHHPVPLPPPSALPSELRTLVEALRAEPAGAFVQRLYREQRHRKAGPPAGG
ncbi:glutathione S-transferase [Sorangium cellulosum]|uniref:Glutathione S-transferase n=1 Tax=Sorangium cellulosum TaxID=56 RepID=A0A150TQI8_SORCE|nr:glutathione S-transferase [Sorangium cellulosum]